MFLRDAASKSQGRAFVHRYELALHKVYSKTFASFYMTIIAIIKSLQISASILAQSYLLNYIK